MLTAFGQMTELNSDVRTIQPDPFGLGFEDSCLECHKTGLPDIIYYCHRLLPAESYSSRLYLELHFAWIAATINIPPDLYLPSTTLGQTNVQVNIFGLALLPAAITIPVGTTVTWTNLDIGVRTLISVADPDSGPSDSFNSIRPFASVDLDPGDSFSYTFTQPGVFNYSLEFYLSEVAQTRFQYDMLGKIVVGDQITDDGPSDDDEDLSEFIPEEAQ